MVSSLYAYLSYVEAIGVRDKPRSLRPGTAPRRGVEVRLKTKVAGYDGKEVALDDGTKIATRMLIWTAGTTPPPLLSTLPCAKQRGRIVANDCLQVPDWPGVWALGDCALVPDALNPGKFYPPTAQHAIRQAAVGE